MYLNQHIIVKSVSFTAPNNSQSEQCEFRSKFTLLSDKCLKNIGFQPAITLEAKQSLWEGMQ